MLNVGVRGSLCLARHFDQPAPVGEMRGHAAAEQDDAVLVEFFMRARRAETLEIIRGRVGVEVYRKYLALDQVGLRRLTQSDGDVGLAHRQIEFFVGGDQRDVDVGIEIDEIRRAVASANARRCRAWSTLPVRRSVSPGCR